MTERIPGPNFGYRTPGRGPVIIEVTQSMADFGHRISITIPQHRVHIGYALNMRLINTHLSFDHFIGQITQRLESIVGAIGPTGLPQRVVQEFFEAFCTSLFRDAEREAEWWTGLHRPMTATEVRMRRNEAIRDFAVYGRSEMRLDRAWLDEFDRSLMGILNEPHHNPDADRAAVAKAEALLRKSLSPSQRDQFNVHKYFDVEIRVGGDPRLNGTYRILDRRSNNVHHLQSGHIYCIVLNTSCPTYDIMLSVKLTLENDPAKFFSTAIRN